MDVTAYHDLDSPQTMHADAAAAGARLPVPASRPDGVDLYSMFPTDLPKPEIEVSEAARRLADAIYG